MQKFEVFQGKKTVEIELPDKWRVHEAPMPKDVPVEDPGIELEKSLASPTGSEPLSEMLKPGDRVAICVTDVSRPCPDYLLLPPVLREIESAGVPKEDVTLIIGVGEHRPVTVDEMKKKFGSDVVENYTVKNHNAHDKENLVDMGMTAEGVPRVVNKLLTEVDFIITIGVVDLHQYAGFSGGAKTIAVGCAGEASIKYTHSADFLDRSGAVPGKVEGNLFQAALWEIVKSLPFKYTVNVILNENGEILALDSGEPRAVHEKMLEVGREKFIYEIDKKFDLVYLGVPFPKDVNLYQATRAATYQALSGRSVFKKGAVLNLIAECPEGFGKGVGEGRFLVKMNAGESAGAILEEMTGKKTLPGEQRAFMVVKTMVSNPINVYGTGISKKELEKAKFLCLGLIPDELRDKEIDVLVMKDGQKKVVMYKG